MAEKAEASKAAPGSKSRPLGVTVISVIGIIFALLAIAGGLVLVGLAGMVGTVGLPAVLGSFSLAIGAVLLVVSIIQLVGYALLLKMKRNGWTIVVVFGIISMVMGALTNALSNVVSIVISLIIVAYLWTQRQLFA